MQARLSRSAAVAEGVRRLDAPVLLALLALHVAFSLFINFWLFRSAALSALVTATGGLVSAELIANLLGLALLVVGVLVAWGGAGAGELGLRGAWIDRDPQRPPKALAIPPVARSSRDPSDLGLGRAALVTLLVWIAMNVAAAAASGLASSGLSLAAGWNQPGHLLVQLGQLLGQLLGNALFEELVFRGVLLVQLALWLERPHTALRLRTLVLATLASQALFALSHLPNRLAFDLWPDATAALIDLLFLWGMGLAFALVWLRTRNLLLVVGLHALVNTPTLLLAGPAWASDAALGLAFVVLMLRSPRRLAM